MEEKKCMCGNEQKDEFLEELCNKYKQVKDNLIQMLNGSSRALWIYSNECSKRIISIFKYTNG